MKLLVVFSIILILFLYIWSESQALKLVNEVNKLNAARNQMVDEKQQRVALLESFSTLPRIEQKALELGLRHVTEADILNRIVR